MLRKISVIAAAIAATLVVLAAPADARRGGYHGRAYHGGHVRVVRFHRGPVRVGRFGYRRAFYSRRFYRAGFYRPGWRRAYYRPFYRPFVRAGFYRSCWRWRPTPWGWRRIWVCGPRYRVFPRRLYW